MRRLHACRIAVLVLCLALLPGCKKKPAAAQADNPPPPAPAEPNGGGLQPRGVNPGVMSMLPSVGRLNPSNDLRQIGLFYLANGRSPSRLEDMADLKRDMPLVYQAIEDGVYVVYWNAPMNGSSRAILGHVRDAPTKGGVVLLLDGSVTNMTPEEFKAAPKVGQ
jgi:hypothetical protein